MGTKSSLFQHYVWLKIFANVSTWWPIKANWFWINRLMIRSNHYTVTTMSSNAYSTIKHNSINRSLVLIYNLPVNRLQTNTNISQPTKQNFFEQNQTAKVILFRQSKLISDKICQRDNPKFKLHQQAKSN